MSIYSTGYRTNIDENIQTWYSEISVLFVDETHQKHYVYTLDINNFDDDLLH